ncbi:MAG TPA: hypothetical protein VFR67_07355 [Pilimelia sp.]|nr:hypothetical protein [Pilimelia sp.]
MAARTAVRGLSDDELQAIRATLAGGRKPKVMFTEAAGQVAGQLGQVVELTDPAESDEWVVVRFGRDELPFSPGDLSLPPRGAAARRGGSKVVAAPAPPEATSPGPPPKPPKTDQRPAPREEASVTTVQTPPAAAPSAPAAEPKPARKAARPARPKGPASLTVTLAYADGEWTVGATQGSKALAKPYVIKPTEALKMVGMLDVPGVHEAVEQIVAAERAEAEAQAQRLRAELAEIEARLAELRDAG